MAAAQYFQQVQKIYIAFYQRPADPAGLQYWASRMDAAGGDVAQVIDAFASSAEALELYGPVNATTIGAVIDSLYMALFNVAPDAAGKQFYVDGFAAGTFTAGTIALAVLNGAQNNDLIAINNKVQVANEFTKQVDGRDFTDPYFGTGNSFNATYSGDADAVAARDILKAVNSQPSTILSSAAVTSALKSQIADVNDPILAVATGQTKLTVGADNIDGVAGNTTYTAPIVQNQNGAVTNTLESGDVISAVGTGNKLVADLTLTTSGGIPAGSAISASTNNIQVVELRSQTPLLDIGGPHPNFSHIDAQNFNGVQQWWTVNSRSDLQIEDVRSRPEETTIGMRDTDPEVGFYVYFDPQQLSNLVRTEDSALNIKLADNDNLTSLANVPVNGLIFKLDGVQFTLKSDAIGNAVTYADLLAALQAEIAKEAGLAGVTATLNPDNTITIQDTAGKSFTPVGWSFINDQVPANGNIIYNQTVGNPALVDQPITTNVLLDNVGRTSPGGVLDIGSLGDGGVEQFDVVVDRSSWVEAMESTSHLGNFVPGIQLDHLEIVNFASTGAKGNVTVGERDTNRVDGRVENGLTDVRVVNGKGFEGKMNLGIVITGDSIDRYLDGATDPVNFTYDGSNKDDIFNIDVDSAVSNDPDFRMDVKMGAGNDRLILTGADNLNNISVDGGTGNNTFVTSTSVGFGVNPADIADHEFASFKNFQTYEVEGTGSNVVNNTVHDFTSMAGIKNVVIATDGNTVVGGRPTVGDNTQLIDLEAAQNVTISGKNQTIGNASTADQLFGNITLTNDAGVNRTITLENTARLSNSINGVRQDGVLTVAALQIDTTPATAVGATRNVTIESEGVRTTANVVANFVGRDVEKLTLTGTQDLTINVVQMADQAANAAPGTSTSTSVQINAAGLTGDLNLAVNAAMLNNFGGVPPMPAQVDTIVGTAGSDDTLMFYGALAAGNAVNASGFESVQLGSANLTMFGDVQVSTTASGTLNTANLGVSTFDMANLGGAVALTGLSGGATVNLGDANRDAAGARVLNQIVNQQIDLQSSATNAASTAGTVTINRSDVIASGSASLISVGDAVVGATPNTGGFRTIDLNVARDASLAAAVADINNITLAVGSQARTLDVDGGVAGRSNVGSKAAQVAAAEVQTLTFAGGPLANAIGDTIIVGGVTVALTNVNSTAAQTATDVFNALTAVAAGTAIGDAAFADNGAGMVTATFVPANGNVADNILAVANGTATLVGTATNATITQGVDAIAAVTGPADVINFTAPLANSLEVIDLSGYNGQVTLVMQEVVVGSQTDVNFSMSAYSANITLTDMVAGAGGSIALITHNSVFDFNGGAGTTTAPSQWTISNIVNDGAAAAGVNNNTLFDLRDLNIANYAAVEVLYVNDGDVTTDLTGYTLAAGTAVIRSESQGNNGTETWEIIVTAADGVALTGAGNALTADNFIF